MTRDINEVLEVSASCLKKGSAEKMRECFDELHPADIAEIFPVLSLAERVKILRSLEPARAAEVLFNIDSKMVAPVLEGLGRKRAAEILAKTYTDDAADLLGDLPPDEKEKILSLMAANDVEDVRELLTYAEDTAGGIMTTEYVALDAETSVEQAIQELRKIAREAETVYYVYVVNEKQQLVGVLSLRELILADAEAAVKDIMQTGVISVNVRTDQEEVAKAVAKYDFLAIPVVNDDDELLGIVTVDDILDVLEEEATEDILRLSANIDAEGQDLEAGTWRRAARRLPWLILLMFGSLLAGNVIAGFSATLERITALAFFITVMAGGPGNVATQSLAVAVRGLAIGNITPGKALSVIFKEARVGILVGLISGAVLSLIAFFWLGEPSIGLVVGMALAINMTIAAAIGSFVPLVINRFGVDPALASGPFITTLMDVTSMLVYFTLASVFLLH